MSDAVAAYDQQDTQKRFLPDLFDQMRGTNTVPQFDIQELAKIASEVTLRLGIAVPQPLKILLVEGGDVQFFLFGRIYVSTVAPLRVTKVDY